MVSAVAFQAQVNMATCSSSSGSGDVFLGVDPAKMMLDAVTMVTKDELYRMSTAPAKQSLDNAEKVLKWRAASDENKKVWEKFAVKCVDILKSCFDTKPREGVKKFRRFTEKERMYACFHQARCTESFRKDWTEFIALAGSDAHPIFYQHITDCMFTELRDLRYPDYGKPEIGLTCAEENTVRAAAGCTVWSILKKLRKQKKSFVWYLEEVIGEVNDGNIHEWTSKSVANGKLIRIGYPLYEFFAAMELSLRKNLCKAPHDLAQIIELLLDDDNVLSSYDNASVNWDDDSAEEYLEMFANHWVTMKAPLHAKSWMEHYGAN